MPLVPSSEWGFRDNIQVVLEGHEPFGAAVVRFAPAGVFVRSPRGLPLGTAVELRIRDIYGAELVGGARVVVSATRMVGFVLGAGASYSIREAFNRWASQQIDGEPLVAPGRPVQAPSVPPPPPMLSVPPGALHSVPPVAPASHPPGPASSVPTPSVPPPGIDALPPLSDVLASAHELRAPRASASGHEEASVSAGTNDLIDDLDM